MFVRLTTSMASETRSWRAGEKFECPEHTAKRLIDSGNAVPFVDGEPDYIPPDGVDAHVIVNKTVREQTTAVQPRKRHPVGV
jgi:uncharacterized protein (DUF2252 family)